MNERATTRHNGVACDRNRPGGQLKRDSPTISLLWFNMSGHTLLASIKTGASVSRQDAAGMDALVAPVRASTLVRKHLSVSRVRKRDAVDHAS
jgi:hypothetical protein